MGHKNYSVRSEHHNKQANTSAETARRKFSNNQFISKQFDDLSALLKAQIKIQEKHTQQ
jgi:hypothetical protein